MITLVIPLYNRERFIKRAIDSVLNQTLQPSQIIVVDDASTNGSTKIVESYGERVELVKLEKNSGVSKARNEGIKRAKGEWIAFLDSDDEWISTKLKMQMEFLERYPEILFVHTGEQWVRDGKRVKQKAHHKKPRGLCFEENLEFCKIAPSSVVIHRSIFDRVGIFDESLEVCEDYDLWIRVLREYEIGLIEDELVIKHGGHEDQLSFKYHSMDRFRIKALLKHLDSESAKRMIKKKCNILEKGAKKRGNVEVLEFCERVMKKLRKI